MRENKDVLYFAVTGLTEAQNSENQFVAIPVGQNEESMQLEVNKPLSYEETSKYILQLRASVSCILISGHVIQYPRE